MLSQKLQAALNDQINAELGSAYLYLAMAAHFEASNLTGSARWMRRPAQEEVSQALKQEQGVTARIHKLYALAAAETDYPTQTMLQWFINEQVEEEKAAKTILEQVRMIGPSNSAIYFLDRHLGKEAEAKE